MLSRTLLTLSVDDREVQRTDVEYLSLVDMNEIQVLDQLSNSRPTCRIPAVIFQIRALSLSTDH